MPRQRNTDSILTDLSALAPPLKKFVLHSLIDLTELGQSGTVNQVGDMDVKKLDTTIRKLQALRALLTDPEVVGALGQNAPASSGPIEDAVLMDKPRKGKLLNACQWAVEQSDKPVSANDVIQKLNEIGYEFDTKDVPIAVATALRKLALDFKRINRVKEGSGRRPHLYEKINPVLANVFNSLGLGTGGQND